MAAEHAVSWWEGLRETFRTHVVSVLGRLAAPIRRQEG